MCRALKRAVKPGEEVVHDNMTKPLWSATAVQRGS